MYSYLKDLVDGRPCQQFPLTGKNDSGEHVLVFEGCNDGVHYYGTDTLQCNDVLRRNVWYEDGTSEEWYER